MVDKICGACAICRDRCHTLLDVFVNEAENAIEKTVYECIIHVAISH